MDTIQLHDLRFKPFLDQKKIAKRVAALGQTLTATYKDKKPLFLSVLNGSFIFAADLIRACEMDAEITFIRLASYEGTESSGEISTVISLKESLKDRHVVIVEDIIDSGATMHHLLPTLQELQPATLALVTLLVKPEALSFDVAIDHIGFKIPNKFVVGYGLDYNGLGRNIKDIYQLE